MGSLPDLSKDSGRKRCLLTLFTGERKNWCGRQPKTEQHKIELMKNVMENDVRRVYENFTATQKRLKLPLVKWRIKEKLREKILPRSPDDVRTRDERLRDVRKRTKEEYSRNKQEKPEQSTW